MILAIDQGTTGTTCLVFDAEGQIAGRAYSEFEQHFPRPGWVEHDAAEIWEVTRRVASRGDRRRRDRGAPSWTAIGIANQRETVVAWDPASGEPLHRALVWQDRRTAARCEELRGGRQRGAGAGADRARHRPLLLRDQDRVAAAQRRGRRAGGLRHDRLLAALQADRPPRDRLHERLADDAVRHPPPRLGRGALRDARRRPGATARSRCPRPTSTARPRSSAARCRWPESPATSRRRCSARPVIAPAAPRTPTAPAASSCSTPAPRHRSPSEGLLTTVACATGEAAAYALEASIFVTGAAVQWLRDGLGIVEEAGETRGPGRLARRQRRRLLRPGADRARLAPLGPLRARHDRRPHPRQRPRPPGAGGAGGDRLPDGRRGAGGGGGGGERLTELKADGGAIANRWLMQFQADVLGAPVVVPEIAETTALGAAYLAGIATGRWSAAQVAEMWREAARYEPRMGCGERERSAGRLAPSRRALARLGALR